MVWPADELDLTESILAEIQSRMKRFNKYDEKLNVIVKMTIGKPHPTFEY